MQDTKSKAYNPWAALFQGNKRTWAEYSVFIMLVKAFMTVGVVFMFEARIRQIILQMVINTTWMSVLMLASPYLSPEATYTDIAAKANQIYTLGMSLGANIGSRATRKSAYYNINIHAYTYKCMCILYMGVSICTAVLVHEVARLARRLSLNGHHIYARYR
jgi:hypothetical protein